MPAQPSTDPKVKVALPNKGRLSDLALDLFDRAGFHVQSQPDRRLFAPTDAGDMVFMFVRAQDVPEFVSEGAAHAGVTGQDVIAEAGHDVEELTTLGFGRCRLALAVPNDSEVTDRESIKSGLRVATSFPRLTRLFFEDLGVDFELVPVSGAAEVTPHIGVADAIVDLVSTGSTLAVNKLREVTTILNSQAALIANVEALDDPDRGDRLRELSWVLDSVTTARNRRYLMANVPRAILDEVRDVIPGISGPTILNIHEDEEMVAVHAVVPETEVFGVVRELKSLGAEGILVTPIERLVP